MSNSIDSELEATLKSIITEKMAKQYVLETEGAPNDAEEKEWFYKEAGKEYQTYLIKQALQAIKALYISRKEVEEAINEVEKPRLGLRVIFRSAVFYELRAKLLPPTKGGNYE